MEWVLANSSVVRATELNNLRNGSYSYTITDLNGCSLSGSRIVHEPGILLLIRVYSNYF